jgi:large subunit ribosomal protein L30
MRKIRIRLVRSPIASKPACRRTVTALGLRRLGSANELEATPAVLGMVRVVSHLVQVEEVTG